MKLKNVVTETLVLALLFLSGCFYGGVGKYATVAKQFMDRYYVQANVSEAKALATPAMAQKIEEQFALFAQAVQIEKGRSHEVSYTMAENKKRGNHVYYYYEVKITTKGAEPLYKRVALSIDWIDGGWWITQFDESASGPTETVR